MVTQLLSNEKPWVYWRDPAEAEPTVVRFRQSAGLLIELEGLSMASPETLFREYATAFRFPDYFGSNWAAFHECMSDLEEVAAPAYLTVIRNARLILAGYPDERVTFLSLLADIGKYWGNSFALDSRWAGGEVPFNTIFLRHRAPLRATPHPAGSAEPN
jgi:hypothetical protein